MLVAASSYSLFSPATRDFGTSLKSQDPGGVIVSSSTPKQENTTDQVKLSPSSGGHGEHAHQAESATPSSNPQVEFSLEQNIELSRLKARDTEVRAHEQAHLAAAGQYAAGGPSFSYQVGPDGKRYAVSGEVPVDISQGATPEETLRKMDRIRAAALAPAQPSAADRQIAAQASLKAAQARQEILLERQAENPVASTSSDGDSPSPEVGPNGSPVYGVAPGGVQISVMIKRYSEVQALKQQVS